MTGSVGVVWSVMLSDSEEKEVIEFLKENDFTPDGAGLKNYLLESMAEEEEELPPKDKLAQFLRDNPEVVGAAGNAFGVAAKMLRKKIGI